jgi:hypothetical protein
MALVKGALAKDLKTFISKANKLTQENSDKAIDAYCNNFENIIYKILRNIDITIPTGAIQVEGSPSAQVNIAPIVLKGVIK